MTSFNDYLSLQKSDGHVNIELTFRCPLMCSQCLRAKLTLPKDNPEYKLWKEKVADSYDMELDNLEKIIKFSNGLISFCGQFSDPIYHPDFYKILELCSRYPDKKFMIHTSAHQKNIDWYRRAYELSAPNIVWKFGLDGIGEVSQIYRQNQKSELIWEAMCLGVKMGIPVHWQFIVFKYNEHQIHDAAKLAKENGMMFKLIFTDRSSEKTEAASEEYRATGKTKKVVVLK